MKKAKLYTLLFVSPLITILLSHCSMLVDYNSRKSSENYNFEEVLTKEKWIDYPEWSEFIPSSDSRILYVSEDGNDSTGQIYNPGDSQIGLDPFNPSGTVRAFATYEEARSNARSGRADWILFRRGDVFTAYIRPLSGESSTSPALVGAYGNSGDLPQIEPETFYDNTTEWDDRRPGLRLYARRGDNCINSVVTSLSFYSPDKDPSNGELANVFGGGLALMSLEDGIIENLLIEGCRFQYFDSNTIQRLDESTLSNVIIKRCQFLDNYTYQSSNIHSQGLYVYRIDGLFLIENVFDHNGWLNQAPLPGEVTPVGKATIFNHNTYLEDCHNVEFYRNISMRPSSINFKFTAETGAASSTKIQLHENLIIDGELGISIGGNQTDTSRFQDIVLSNNIITEMGTSCPTNRDVAWGIVVQDWEKGLLQHNLLTHFKNPRMSDNNRGVEFNGGLTNTDITENTCYNILGEGISFNERSDSQRYNNTFSYNRIHMNNSEHSWIKVVSASSSDGLDFKSNSYDSVYNDHPFRLEGNWNMDFDAWSVATGDMSEFGPKNYIDPERTVAAYSRISGGEESLSAFIEACRSNNRYNWNNTYTAKTINDWLKQGFNEID